MILRSHFTGIMIGLMALAASSITGCPKPPRPTAVQLQQISVPPGVFSISGEVMAFRAAGEAGRTARVQQSLQFLRARFGNFDRAILYEFNVNGERLARRDLRVSGDASVSFQATTGSSYLVYVDFGERSRNSYRIACRAARLAIGGQLAPRVCEQIFCTRDTFRVSELTRRVSGLGDRSGLSGLGDGLAGGFGASGDICSQCLDSSFYPVDECSQTITLPPIRHYTPTPEPIYGPPDDPDAGVIRIVSVGDSYASGEGAPDVNASGCNLGEVSPTLLPWKVHCDRYAEWKGNDEWDASHSSDRRVPSDDDSCSRSTNAGARKAADAFRAEAGLPVEFVSVACAGAQVADLIGKDAAGGDLGNGELGFKPQFDQIEQLFPTRRRIDALIVGIGGNDVGFAKMVRKCIEKPPPPPNFRRPPLIPPPPGWCQRPAEDNDIPKLSGELAARYDRLAEAISTRLNVGAVLITEYPNPMFKDDGSICANEPDGDPLMGIQAEESEWAANTVIPALNRTVQEAAARHAGRGWRYVGNVAAGFMGHGYCASDPFLNTVHRSYEIEGKESGGVHPNVAGYGVYRDAILAKLRELKPPDAPTIVINRPNALNESTAVASNSFDIAWDSGADNFTSVRTAHRRRGERGWQFSTSPVNPQNPSQKFHLGESGTYDFAVSVCTQMKCSPWSAPVRASNELETFATPENLRLGYVAGAAVPAGRFVLLSFDLSLAWDAPPHLPSAWYELAVAYNRGWISRRVDFAEITASPIIRMGDGLHDAWVRQCAPKVWSRNEAGPVTCSPWSPGFRFALPSTVPSTPALSIEPVSDTVRPFTVKWRVNSGNQTGSQVAYVTGAREAAYEFLEVSAEQTEHTFDTRPLAVRVRACNQTGCSGWSNDVYDPTRSAESLSAAPTPHFMTPPHIVPPEPLP
jgi:lysophospholipase L1-like esterase